MQTVKFTSAGLNTGGWNNLARLELKVRPQQLNYYTLTFRRSNPLAAADQRGADTGLTAYTRRHVKAEVIDSYLDRKLGSAWRCVHVN